MAQRNDGKKGGEGSTFDELWERVRAQGETLTPEDVRTMLAEYMRAREGTPKKPSKPKRRSEKKKTTVEDPEAIAAEEARIAEITSMDLPLDWENAFLDDPRATGVHVESIPDALVLSLTTLGRVDIEYISAITGEDCKGVISALRGSIYQNPETWEECFFRGWETAEEYLSGDLFRKLTVAKAANRKYNGYFRENVNALRQLMPSPVDASDIYVTLGSPWVPAVIIDDFIAHIMPPSKRRLSGTIHDEASGSWEIPHKDYYFSVNPIAMSHTYGTQRMDALTILEKTLNMKSATVYDEVRDFVDGKTRSRRIVNKAETTAALERQQKLIEEFQRWVMEDEDRKKQLHTIFTERYGYIRRRIFDGSFLTFPTMAPGITLYPYQKDAVARILFSPNTLLAHDVGSGKTYIMIAAGMELRRMGISKRNLYVVPNGVLGQWEGIFRTMYPDANLLVVSPSRFVPERRTAVLERIRDEDFDAILMAASCFEQIPISNDYYEAVLAESAETLTRLAKTPAKATKKVERLRDSAKKKLADLITERKKRPPVTFDELNIDRLFVDEAHNYKNLPIDTQSDRVLGISTTGSKKCSDMLDKVRIVQRRCDGGGVIMATGTPITNSITDIYVMQQYLQSGALALLDLGSFDSWIGMFAERVTEFEIGVDTTTYRMATRFAKFHNLPELTALLSGIADFHRVDPSAGIPEFRGYSDVLLTRTPAFADFLRRISARADDVRCGRVRMKVDNMLKITTDGRKAALDLRLAEPEADFTELSKVYSCAENIHKIWRMTTPQRSTQLVFCDISTPKEGFNMYDELSRLLVTMGIPVEEIAYIHDATSESRKATLLSRARSGDIRVLIGSTPKLGLGVNVQDKLIAIHHLDVPWRPADMTQREGRILRQGNENREVFIFRYITEGSFDAYSWQLLETKQRFITGLLSGTLDERYGADVEGTVLNYAEVKALAIGNPLVKERVEVSNALTRALLLDRRAAEARLRLQHEATELPGRIRHQTEVVKACREDVKFLKECEPLELSLEEKRALREEIALALRENILTHEERELLTYRGFRVVLPANMDVRSPFVWIVREGRYYVEMGTAEMGMLVRLDHYIDTLGDHLKKLRDGLNALKNRRDGIAAELDRESGYAEEIRRLAGRLADLDEQLGVNNDE